MSNTAWAKSWTQVFEHRVTGLSGKALADLAHILW
jgi:hypothetical protein